MPAVIPENLKLPNPKNLIQTHKCQPPGNIVGIRVSHFVGKTTDLKSSNLPTIMKQISEDFNKTDLGKQISTVLIEEVYVISTQDFLFLNFYLSILISCIEADDKRRFYVEYTYKESKVIRYNYLINIFPDK